ncbi:hypothetical protein COY27_01600 [Candidatus Woesearchaeota archaeon CG_4_10_14_0_2_um_filter_33_13]|nr:MAG: hypothetical protein COY27_01600 [Candidatus Woesearchaeota archaeon CG_4_10_14_0_2_um_filter_33_13]
MVSTIQIVGILFGVFMLYVTYLKFRKNEFTVKEMIGWFLVWISFMLLTLFSYTLDYFIRKMSLSRPIDLLTVLGILFLIALSFYNYTNIKRLQLKMEDMVRKIALEKK